jgi:hypothetical protein
MMKLHNTQRKTSWWKNPVLLAGLMASGIVGALVVSALLENGPALASPTSSAPRAVPRLGISGGAFGMGPVFGTNQLAQLATVVAAQSGDAHPTSVTYVNSTRQAAQTLISQDVVGSDQPVAVVEMVGSFSAVDIPVPKGEARPGGTVLILTVDPSNGSVIDMSVGDSQLALSTRTHSVIPWSLPSR